MKNYVMSISNRNKALLPTMIMLYIVSSILEHFNEDGYYIFSILLFLSFSFVMLKNSMEKKFGSYDNSSIAYHTSNHLIYACTVSTTVHFFFKFIRSASTYNMLEALIIALGSLILWNIDRENEDKQLKKIT